MRAVLSILIAISFSLLLGSCSAVSGEEPPLERRINSLLELHTVEYRYRDIVYFGEQEYLLGIFRTKDRQLLFAVDILVQAGIDLNGEIELFRDRERPELAVVRIPAPKILLVDADEGSIEQFFVRERGGSIAWDQVATEMEAVKERVEADAVRNGILRHAEKNAVRLIRETLELAGFEEVTVQVRPAGELRG